MFAREHLHKPFLVTPTLSWKEAWGDKVFSRAFALTVTYWIGLVIFFNHFLPHINQRLGFELRDPILAHLPAVDLSWWIFPLIYAGILAAAINLLAQPGPLLRCLVALALVYTLRIGTLLVVPLAPPAGCIPLADPFVLHFAYGGVLITRDLFFSGHTACLLTLALSVRKRWLRKALMGLTAVVAIMLLIQHAHYTIDILGALIAAPLARRISGRVTA